MSVIIILILKYYNFDLIKVDSINFKQRRWNLIVK